MTCMLPNCILLPYDKIYCAHILREFKTQHRSNPKLYSPELGLDLSDEVLASLGQHPRDNDIHIMFTQARSSNPYTYGRFHQYALKARALFGKPCTPFIHLQHACLRPAN